MIRDTKLGRWVRRHDRTHKLIHATWCRALGPFDTKRVASSGGTMTGGTGPSLVDYELTIGPTTYKFGTLAGAQNWANDNQPDSIYTVFAVYSDGSSKVAYSGPKTGPALPVVPGASFLVVYAPFDVAAGLKYTGATASDATAWAKANCPVGVAWSVYQQGDGLIASGTGSNTTPPTAPYVPNNPPVQVGWIVTADNIGPGGKDYPQRAYDTTPAGRDADIQLFKQSGFTNIQVNPWYSQ